MIKFYLKLILIPPVTALLFCFIYAKLEPNSFEENDYLGLLFGSIWLVDSIYYFSQKKNYVNETINQEETT